MGNQSPAEPPLRLAMRSDQQMVRHDRHGDRLSHLYEEVPPAFFDWMAREDISPHFVPASEEPDILVTQVHYHWTEDDSRYWLNKRESLGLPLVVMYCLDSLDDPQRGGWEREESWRTDLSAFVQSADLVCGPQLSLENLDPDQALPIHYGAFVEPGAATEPRTVDVYFNGAHKEPDPAASKFSREYRGYLASLLQEGMPEYRLDLGRIHFWAANPTRPWSKELDGDPDKQTLLQQHTRRIDSARLSWAPRGYGYYTVRHCDVMVRGGVTLCEDVTQNIRIPEPELWQEAVVTYSVDGPNGSDIAEVAKSALADESLLERKRKAAVAYAERYLDPARQVADIAAAIRRLGA